MALVGPRLERWAASADVEFRARDIYRRGLFLAIILAVWISTRPFYAAPADGSVPSGDILNQITFSGLALLSFGALLMVDRRALLPVLQPSYAVMVLWMIVTTAASTQPAISQRAFAFTLIVMFLAASLFALPRRLADFQNLLFAAALIVMGVAYAGIVALPDLALHTDFDPFEPEHAGSWKGHFDHKNIAGAMMAVMASIGIYALRLKRRLLGAALLVGGVMFLYFTKSKTSLALFPLVVVCCLMAERLPSLVLRLGLCLGPVVLMLGLTLGSVLVEPIGEFNKAVMRDPTFTGRFDIWRYGFEMFVERPWLGYGFEAFWQTSTTLNGESKLELAWAVEKIIHGHNGYLDVMLTQGLPGLAIVVVVFLIKPIIDYHRAAAALENRAIATMFLMMWMFIALGMCLEVYFFRRSDPVWFALLVGVFGLRFTAAYRIAR
jgi:O-antigen ligase